MLHGVLDTASLVFAGRQARALLSSPFSRNMYLTPANEGADSGILSSLKPTQAQLLLNRAVSPFLNTFSLIKDRASNVLLLSACILAPVLCGCSLIAPLVSAAMPYAGAKMMFACIPEHTSVDTPSGSRPIELLEAGDVVIGFSGKPVRILQKHCYLENPETVFLHITFVGGASVDLCGMHRVAGIRAQRIRLGQSIAGREVTSIESRHGETHSFDLLTEDAGYQIHGVPVNSMIEEMREAMASGMRSVRQ